MIIFGSAARERWIEAGSFRCPACRTQQRYDRFALRRYFTLYFIPIIPLGQLGEQIACAGCSSRFAPDVLFGPQSGEPILAEVADGPHAAFPTNYPASSLPSTSGLAIASMILGIVSCVLICGLSLLTSIPAIITGHVALAKIFAGQTQIVLRWDFAQNQNLLAFAAQRIFNADDAIGARGNRGAGHDPNRLP